MVGFVSGGCKWTVVGETVFDHRPSLVGGSDVDVFYIYYILF